MRFLLLPAPLAAADPFDVLARSSTAIHQRCAGKYFGSIVARHNSTPGDSPAVPAAADWCKSAPFLRPTREPSPPPPPRPTAAAASVPGCSTLILWQSIRTAFCCCCCFCLYCPATFPTHPTLTTIRFLDFLFASFLLWPISSNSSHALFTHLTTSKH